MQKFKLLFLLIITMPFLAACDEKADPALSQILTVLSATTGKSAKGAAPATSASASTYRNMGGVTIQAKNLGTVGDFVNGDVYLDYRDVQGRTGPATFFIKTERDSGSYAGTPFSTELRTVLAMGGVNAGMKYGDFGYWVQTAQKTTGTDTTYAYMSDAVMFFDDKDKATNITIEAGQTGAYTFTGNILGSAELYDHSSGAKNLESVAQVTGDISLEADFKNSSFDYLMSLYINGAKWYDFEDAGGSIDLSTGSFSSSNKMTVSGTPAAGAADYSAANTSNINSSFEGQFLGADSNTIPTEGVGVFGIEFADANSSGYSTKVNGAFGIKR
ncbi:hypothetical protein Dip510_000202 [Elusimicrobium posterum]|uniref:hypothetical protein n=1 Tax=Elusimicrobium posterum TaxID=3116653 RepID=UPI003C7156F4